MTPPTKLDLLMRWVGEEAAGTWPGFRRAHDWLLSESGAPSAVPAWRTAWTLASLGHMEVDWVEERWAAAEPCLTTLPSAGAIAVLVGARPRALEESFWRYADAEAPPDLLPATASSPGAPTTFYVQYGTEDVLMDFADRLGVRVERRAAETLGRNLPEIEKIVEQAEPAAPPPRSFEIQKFNSETLRWDAAADGHTYGLFRYRAPGEVRHLLFDVGYRHVSREAGIWAVLAHTGRNVIAYAPDTVNGELRVPRLAGLPLLQARAAVLCTGLVPAFEHGTLRFSNVPRQLADRIAASLGQTVEEVSRV